MTELDSLPLFQACTGGGCTISGVTSDTTEESAPEGLPDPVITSPSPTELGISWGLPELPNGMSAASHAFVLRALISTTLLLESSSAVSPRDMLNSFKAGIADAIASFNAFAPRLICTMLDQRRRRWAGVVQMLYKCVVFAGIISIVSVIWDPQMNI